MFAHATHSRIREAWIDVIPGEVEHRERREIDRLGRRAGADKVVPSEVEALQGPKRAEGGRKNAGYGVVDVEPGDGGGGSNWRRSRGHAHRDWLESQLERAPVGLEISALAARRWSASEEATVWGGSTGELQSTNMPCGVFLFGVLQYLKI
jgi:hypothetical protein